jgi:hypothetical protein
MVYDRIAQNRRKTTALALFVIASIVPFVVAASLAFSELVVSQPRWLSMAAVAAGLVAVLALLFWGLSSSPTSRVLSLCGARPAGPSESEAHRLLEDLATAAVITSDQTLGYIPFSIKLQPVDMLPAEVFDGLGRTAVAPAQGEQAAAPRAARNSRLNETQVAFSVLFGLAVFVFVFMALLKFGGN